MEPARATPRAGEGPANFGRYEVVRKLGEGGMGAVYLARDSKLDRPVAVKVLPPHAVNDAGAIARFQREARALAKLAHPGIVQAHDSGQDGGRHFLVMEYVEGRSLADVLAEKGSLSPGRAADVIHQAALALHHAHESGLVHRDVKPGNLLLTSKGQVKLLDLGLARFLQDQVADPSRTREGVGMGTPDYAAPEQFLDATKVDHRADIYSLGCTLYHLLTGQVPFPGSSLSEKCQAHQTREPTPVEERCPDVPAGLALVVRRMMAKRPADRFRSAREAAEALVPHVAGSSASFQAFKDTTTWNGGQLTRTDVRPRRRLALLLAAVAATALAFAAGVTAPRLWTKPTQQNERAGGGPPVVPADKEKPPDKEPPAEKEDPNVLTVAKTGKAKYRTIGAALEAAAPGMTVRVLDDSTYEEVLSLNLKAQANITLEAVRGATIHTRTPSNLITLERVPGVTIRGFRLGGPGVSKSLVLIRGECPGLVLERLELTAPSSEFAAVEIADSVNRERPIVVRDCHFSQVEMGVLVNGLGLDYETPFPTEGVLVLDNLMKSCGKGVALQGSLRGVLVAGNRVWRAKYAGLQIERQFRENGDLVLVNNTTLQSAAGFRLWDTMRKGKGIAVRNNLFLESNLGDMIFFNSGGTRDKVKRAGDGASLHEGGWALGHNWREGKEPSGDGLVPKSIIPLAATDTRREQIDRIERKATDAAAFLRPAKDAEWLTKGAGSDDPSLPRYVGALPPAGEKAWDWEKTWKAMAQKSEPPKR